MGFILTSIYYTFQLNNTKRRNRDMEKINKDSKQVRDKLSELCVKLRLEFSNMRIRHPLLIFMLMWVRFLLGTFFNLAMLGTQSTTAFNLIHRLWRVFTGFGMSSYMEPINFVILSAITVFYGFTMFSFASQNPKIRENALMINVVVFVVGPTVARYVAQVIANPNSQKWSQPLLIVGVGCLLLGFAMELIFYTFALSSKMHNSNLLCCQKNFLILVKLTLNNIIIIITPILLHLYDRSSFCTVLTSIHLAASLGPIYSITSEFIFHSEYSEFVYMTISCLEFSFSLIALTCQISKDLLFVDNLQLLTIILSLFLYHGIKQYKKFRDNKIIIEQLLQTRSLKIYLHILSGSLMENDSSSDLDFIVNVLRDRHKKICNTSSCICQIDQSRREDIEDFKMFLIATTIRKFMTDFQHNFQLSVMCAFFLLDFLRIFPDLLTNLNRIRQVSNLSISQELEYYYFKSCMKNYLEQKSLDSHALQTERIQEQDQFLVFFTVTTKQILQYKCEFWSNLSKRTPNLIAIKNCVDKQTELIQKLEDIFSHVFKHFIYSHILLGFISIYDSCIRLKNNLRAQFTEALRYECIKKMEATKISKGQNFKMEALLFDRNSVIFQSEVEENRMGIILNVSKNIEYVFGFKPEAITGQNINEIMPKSMQKQHDIILSSWRERASWTNIHKVRHIFAMNKDSLCFSTSIYLRIVQRLDTINILATFLKANENDYLLINEDGIIDGLGLNFRKILGNQIAKIPFSTICDDTELLYSDAKNINQKKKTTLTCYHTKGLEEKLENYQLRKYQISQSIQEENLLPELEIKTSSRCLKILVSYEPYRMGSRFFVVLKFLSVQKMKQIVSESGKKNDFNTSQIIQRAHFDSDTHHSDTNKKVCEEYNSSIHTSNFGLSASSQSLFLNLQEKMKKTHTFANRQICLYLGVILICIFTLIVSLLVEHSLELYFNDNFDDHSKQSFRFFKKFISLSLAHSRIINIQDNQAEANFQIKRVIVQLKRVEQTLDSQHIGLYLQDQWGKPASLTKLMPFKQINNETTTTTVFEEYYNFHLAYCRRIYEQYIKKQEFFKQDEFELIELNQDNFEIYISDSLRILENSILQDLQKSIMLSRSIAAIYTFFAILIGYLVQKVHQNEEKHANEIFDVYFSISDKNCQSCTNYYRKVIEIFRQKATTSGVTGNQAKIIEVQIIDKNPLISLRKKFEIQPDKFGRKKTSNVSLESKRLKIKIIGLGLLMLIGIILKQVECESAYVKQTKFINIYFSIFTSEKQLVNQFLTIKKITRNSILEQNFIHPIENIIKSLQKNSLEGFVAIFFRLLNVAKELDPRNEHVLQSQHESLCQIIFQQDPQYYDYACMHSQTFPFRKLKLFQAHSIILENMLNQIMLIKQRSNIADLKPSEQKLTEDIINLKYIYLCKFFSDFERVTDSYHNDKIRLLLCITISIMLSLVALMVIIVWFSRRASGAMNRNCGRVLVIPELVLKSTKGAMKHIDIVLQSVE